MGNSIEKVGNKDENFQETSEAKSKQDRMIEYYKRQGLDIYELNGFLYAVKAEKREKKKLNPIILQKMKSLNNFSVK